MLPMLPYPVVNVIIPLSHQWCCPTPAINVAILHHDPCPTLPPSIGNYNLPSSLSLSLSLVSPNKQTPLLLQNRVDEALASILELRFKNHTKSVGSTSSTENRLLIQSGKTGQNRSTTCQNQSKIENKVPNHFIDRFGF